MSFQNESEDNQSENNYLLSTNILFQEKIKGWFEKENKNILLLNDLEDMRSKLEVLLHLNSNVVLDIVEGGECFDSFQGIDRMGNKSDKKLKLIVSDLFTRDEQRKTSYLDFGPMHFLVYYDSMRPHKNFLAINAKNIRIMEEVENEEYFSIKIPRDILLLHPKGSAYNLKDEEKIDLIGRLKGYPLFNAA